MMKILTINDVAEMLQRSTRSIRRDVQLARIPAPFRVGGALRWRESDVVAFVASAPAINLEVVRNGK